MVSHPPQNRSQAGEARLSAESASLRSGQSAQPSLREATGEKASFALYSSCWNAPGVQQLNKGKIATGRIKPVFFCQIL